MNAYRTLLAAIAISTVLTLGSTPGAYADDTELFLAASDPALKRAQPNLLFIFDTSGSMANNTVLTQNAWEASLQFSGCYEPDRIYWVSGGPGTRPDCQSDNWFYKSANMCEASKSSLDGIGQWTGNVLEWKTFKADQWVELNGKSNTRNRFRECEADAGMHGENGASSAKYAADGRLGPWTSDSSKAVTWNYDYTLYDGNWLNWREGGGVVEMSRFDVMKAVAVRLAQNLNNVNVGLMEFNKNDIDPRSGGPVSFPVKDIDSHRAEFIRAIENLQDNQYTPLSETMYEAGQYFAGGTVQWGNATGDGTELSVAAAREGGIITGANYDSPIEFSCQKNYVVLLTDGAPTNDIDSQSAIESLPQFSSLVGSGCDGAGDGACLDDMAEYLYKHDLNPLISGTQNVTTYTIGFTVDLPLLKSTAERGGGEYYLADDTGSLATAMSSIALSIVEDDTSFTAPTVPVNAFNRLENLNDVFVSVFEPSRSIHWSGNLKKYQLRGGRLQDANDIPAIDSKTGFFLDTAQSFWSASPDGDKVRQGGAALQLPAYTSRKLYSNLSGTRNVPLTTSQNTIQTSNTAITPALIGSSALDRDTVINWALGLDINDEDDDGAVDDIRHVMGDPLHVQPVTMIYGGTQDNPDLVVFVSTNDGYMHAVDGATGEELWAFIPSRLLGRLNDLFINEPVANRRYGLDGEIQPYIMNNDFIPGITGDERALLLFGMRRGGGAVFALDVSNRNSPKLAWVIDNTMPGFERLGQTWSKPSVADVLIDGEIRTVAIIAGGYDEGQDAVGYRTDTVGNAVLMLDIEDGSLVWSASPDPSGPSGTGTLGHLQLAGMEHSIPAPVRVIDLNGDGLADRMYVGDMGGRIWRFDIRNGLTSNETDEKLVEGGLIASLGAADIQSNPIEQVRRFYATPDLVAVAPDHANPFLVINIGSGHRAHPLETDNDDFFFSVRDFQATTIRKSTDYKSYVTISDLIDITDVTDPVVKHSDAGWMLGLNNSVGEKVLSKSITIRGTVFFTSFSPASSGSACQAAAGSNRLYQVSISNGAGTDSQLNMGGIAPGPIVFFPSSEDDDNKDYDADCLFGGDCNPSDPDSNPDIDSDPEGEPGDPAGEDGNPEGPCVAVLDVFTCLGGNNFTRTYWFQDETQ